MHVPQNKIHAHLTEVGIRISAGEIDHILSSGQEIFHEEKEAVLETGLKISPFIVADDTGHRHKGKNGYGTHIGNDLFAYFQSSDRKNRINFLEILRGLSAVRANSRRHKNQYCLTGFAMEYLKKQGFPEPKIQLLKRGLGKEFHDESELLEFLKNFGIRGEMHIKTVVEGTLIGAILKHRTNGNLTVISDDAGQFDVLSHALCWVHSERVITSLNTVSVEQDALVKDVLNDFWEFFKSLHAYKINPSEKERQNLDRRFDEIFSRETGYPSLNKACLSLKNKKAELLLVLNQPQLPLSNNISERDIRDLATKRKISAGTRSNAGRKCRDTFLSLKKTCQKLDVSFRKYLFDRLSGQNAIPKLVDLMRKKADLIYGPRPAF